MRPGDGGLAEAGPADRVLLEHRRRVEPPDARPSLAAVGRARRHRRPHRRAARTARHRHPLGVPCPIPEGADVLVIGSGTVGLLTQVALRRYAQPGRVIVAAKHTAQRAAAKMAGADEVVRPEHALKAVRRAGHAVKLSPRAGPGLPARRRRRGVRVHGLEARARHGAAHDEGRRAGRGERHPGPRRRPHAPVVPRARARRRVHDRHGGDAGGPPAFVRAGARAREPDRPDARPHGGRDLPARALARRRRPRDVGRASRHLQGGLRPPGELHPPPVPELQTTATT